MKLCYILLETWIYIYLALQNKRKDLLHFSRKEIENEHKTKTDVPVGWDNGKKVEQNLIKMYPFEKY